MFSKKVIRVKDNLITGMTPHLVMVMMSRHLTTSTSDLWCLVRPFAAAVVMVTVYKHGFWCSCGRRMKIGKAAGRKNTDYWQD